MVDGSFHGVDLFDYSWLSGRAGMPLTAGRLYVTIHREGIDNPSGQFTNRCGVPIIYLMHLMNKPARARSSLLEMR